MSQFLNKVSQSNTSCTNSFFGTLMEPVTSSADDAWQSNIMSMSSSNSHTPEELKSFFDDTILQDNNQVMPSVCVTSSSKTCQINSSLTSSANSNTFVVVRYLKCDLITSNVEVQTDIFVQDTLKIFSMSSKACQTTKVKFFD